MCCDILQERCSRTQEVSLMEFTAPMLNGNTHNYMLSRSMKKRNVMNLPLLFRAITPDLHFDWKRIRYMKISKINKQNKYDKKKNRAKIPPSNLSNTLKTFSKLNVRVLEDKRICFAGRMLRGIFMPENPLLQKFVMESFLGWYSSCIEVEVDAYGVDTSCFFNRENIFLKAYLGCMKSFWNFMPKKTFFRFT